MKHVLSARLAPDKPLALILTLSLALVIRLLGIASRPIWYDEAFSILFSEKGIAGMIAGTLSRTGASAAEEHPLLYYALVSEWIRYFGDSLIAVRALSVVVGLLVVLFVFLLAKSLFGARIGTAAALLASASPFQVHYAQEIRMYVWLCLWLVLATYSYRRATESSCWSWWLAFAVFAALGQYTHNLAAFYLFALALWPVLRRDWQSAKRVFLAGMVALLLYLPWLTYLPSQFAKVEAGYWVPRPEPYRLFTLMLMFVTNLPLPTTQLAAGLMISLFAIAIAAIQTVKAVRSRQHDVVHGLWMLYLAFFPALILFVFSQWKPVYLERALLPSGAIFCAWLAWSIFGTKLSAPVRILTVCLLVIGFGMGLHQHVTDTGGIYGPYQAVMQYLESNREPGDVIIHSSKLSMLPSVYFDRSLHQDYISDPPGSAEDTLAPETQHVLGLVAKNDLEAATGGARRVWFIIYDESILEYARAGYGTHPQVSWLLKRYSVVQEKQWGTLRVYLLANAR